MPCIDPIAERAYWAQRARQRWRCSHAIQVSPWHKIVAKATQTSAMIHAVLALALGGGMAAGLLAVLWLIHRWAGWAMLSPSALMVPCGLGMWLKLWWDAQQGSRAARQRERWASEDDQWLERARQVDRMEQARALEAVMGVVPHVPRKRL